jgi:NDP-sugar pyrophosphorylase family protein
MNSAGIIAAGWGERLGQKIPKALTHVGGKALIDYTLDGLQAAGIKRVTCIVNGAARSVPEHVAKTNRKIEMDWIIQTTPSSMHSFLIVLERLASFASPLPSPTGRGRQSPGEAYLITTVDSVCPPAAYRQFLEDSSRFPDADVCLGLTTFVDDEKPLRVALRGSQIVDLGDPVTKSDYVTAGFYYVHPKILKEKEAALALKNPALRRFLGHLLSCGYRFCGVPLPTVVDVDRPEDVRAAEKLMKEVVP